MAAFNVNEYHIDLCASEADPPIQQTLSCGQTFKHAMCGSDVNGTINVSNQVYQIQEGYSADLPSPAGNGSVWTVQHKRSTRTNDPGTVYFFSSNLFEFG